jgi:hypothetical protein
MRNSIFFVSVVAVARVSGGSGPTNIEMAVYAKEREPAKNIPPKACFRLIFFLRFRRFPPRGYEEHPGLFSGEQKEENNLFLEKNFVIDLFIGFLFLYPLDYFP